MRTTYAQPLLVFAVDRKNMQVVRIDNDHERQASHEAVQTTWAVLFPQAQNMTSFVAGDIHQEEERPDETSYGAERPL